MKPEIKAQVIIHQPAATIAPDEVVRSLTGMSIDDLVRDMHINPGGKYDAYLPREAADGGAEAD